jgi:hypothetical protein
VHFLSISINNQATVFLFSIVLGILLAFFYDLAKTARRMYLLNFEKILVLDLSYFLLSGIISFLFIIGFNNGKIRFYILSAEIIGFLFYRLLFRDKIVNFFCKLIRFFKKLLKPIIAKSKLLTMRFIFVLRKTTNTFLKIILDTFKSILKVFSKILQYLFNAMLQKQS